MKKSSQGYSVAIVNPMTLVGKEVRSILRERGFPYSGVHLLDSSGKEEGTLTEGEEGAAVVTRATADELIAHDVVFFCGQPAGNELLVRHHDPAGFLVIDLSQPSASGAGGVPVVAGINLERLQDETSLLVSPHPIAIPLALILHSIRRIVPVTLCGASVIQPASEFGQEGIDELFAQTLAVLNVTTPPRKIFDHQLAFNLYPAPEARETERYVSSQVREALGSDFPVSLSITQGTTFHSHTFSIYLRTAEPITEEQARASLRGNAALEVAEAEETYTTVDAGGRDEVLIGRVACDPESPHDLWIWASSDNLRRSSALNAVLIAEQMIARFGAPVN